MVLEVEWRVSEQFVMESKHIYRTSDSCSSFLNSYLVNNNDR